MTDKLSNRKCFPVKKTCSEMFNNESCCALSSSPPTIGLLPKNLLPVNSISTTYLNNASRNSLLSSPAVQSRVSQKHCLVDDITGAGSRCSLHSPVIRVRDRAATSSCSTRNDIRSFNSSKNYFDKDFKTFKEAHMNKYLAISGTSRVPSYSGSELDTLSTCGHCGHNKVLDSPFLRSHNAHFVCRTEGRTDIPVSPNMNFNKRYMECFVSDVKDENIAPGSYTPPMGRHTYNRQMPFVRFLCWSSKTRDGYDADLNHLDTTAERHMNDQLSGTGRLTVRFQYFRDVKEVCVTLLDISSITEKLSKPYNVYTKICLIPGKSQAQFSSRHNHTHTSAKEEKFHFRVEKKDLSRYNLVIKLYNKPRVFSLPKPIGKCTIALGQYASSEPAYIVWPINHRS